MAVKMRPIFEAFGVRHVFAKRMEPPSAPSLTERGGQKKRRLFRKTLFSAPLFLSGWFG
jgi:hypothetical protein